MESCRGGVQLLEEPREARASVHMPFGLPVMVPANSDGFLAAPAPNSVNGNIV
jgi:hypothetical protein